jgi:hypothetical protein
MPHSLEKISEIEKRIQEEKRRQQYEQQLEQHMF